MAIGKESLHNQSTYILYMNRKENVRKDFVFISRVNCMKRTGGQSLVKSTKLFLRNGPQGVKEGGGINCLLLNSQKRVLQYK